MIFGRFSLKVTVSSMTGCYWQNNRTDRWYTIIKPTRSFFIDPFGKVIHTFDQKYDSEYVFMDGLASAYEPGSGKTGFIHSSGQLVIPYRYTYAKGFSEEMASVQNSAGKFGFIDTKGKTVISFKYSNAGNFSEGLAAVQNAQGKWGYVNRKGELAVPFQFSAAGNFSNGLAYVANSRGKYSYIDRTGTTRIATLSYSRVFDFHDGVALVSMKTKTGAEKFGYMDSGGKLLTKVEFDYASSSFNGKAAVGVKSMDKGIAVILTQSH